MGQLLRVVNKDDLKDGEMKVVTASGRDILIVRAGDYYYATDSRCPHLGGNLGKGKLEGTIITCPLHGSQFDIADGKVVRWTNFSGFASKLGKLLKSPKPLVVYKVKVEGDQLLVEV